MIAEGNARIGAGVVVADAPAFYQPGTIYMACGRGGLCGARSAGGRPARRGCRARPYSHKRARRPRRSRRRRCSNPPACPRSTASRSNPGAARPGLTRRPRNLGVERVLLLGDAAGYVEPFTGEGIAWSLALGRGDRPARRRGRAAVVRRCHPAMGKALHARPARPAANAPARAVTRLLRREMLTRAVVALLSLAPSLAGPVVRRIGAAPLRNDASRPRGSHHLAPRLAALRGRLRHRRAASRGAKWIPHPPSSLTTGTVYFPAPSWESP